MSYYYGNLSIGNHIINCHYNNDDTLKSLKSEKFTKKIYTDIYQYFDNNYIIYDKKHIKQYIRARILSFMMY